jgi:hypothetical protein
MKRARQLTVLMLWAGYLAATLQGSRLPDEPVSAGEKTAQAANQAGYRSGTGTDKEEYPPRSESTYA